MVSNNFNIANNNQSNMNNNSTYIKLSYPKTGLLIPKEDGNHMITYSKGENIKEENIKLKNNNELMTLYIPVDKNNQRIVNKPIIYFNKNDSNIKMKIEKENFFEAKKFLIDECKISSDILDDQGDADCGWRINGKSGPNGYLKDYIPPIGWTGIGLKVINLYDNMNNDWIKTDNNKGEWYIGYHGVKDLEGIKGICKEGFRRGDGQAHKNKPNINPLSKFKYNVCGEGVYFTPDINEAKSYTNPILYNGSNYSVVFMCRINPKEVKIADIGGGNEYWIVNGDKLGDLFGERKINEVRPYRILFLKQ